MFCAHFFDRKMSVWFKVHLLKKPNESIALNIEKSILWLKSIYFLIKSKELNSMVRK